MDDRYDRLVRRAAELKAESAALMLVSGELVSRVAQRRQAGILAMEQRGEQGTAAGLPDAGPASSAPEVASFLPGPGSGRGTGIRGGVSAGELPLRRPRPGILDGDEATALAGLLEELATRYRLDPLCGPVSRVAVLLRQRVAAARQRSIWLRWGDPAARREVGDTRDVDAGDRDIQAAHRDLLAAGRDELAKERDLLADTADEQARVGGRRIRDLLSEAELRGRAAAERAAAPTSAPGDAGWQLGQPATGAARARARDGEDRDAIREILALSLTVRQAAWRDRHAAGQDRAAANRDRGSAQADRRAADRDRQTARADRDQAVIESQEEDPV